MKNLLKALKMIASEAIFAVGHQSENGTKAIEAIKQLESQEELFNRKYAVYGKRLSSLNSHRHWQIICIADSLAEAHEFMSKADEEMLCQEILTLD